MDKRRLLPWTIAVSFLLHGAAYASLDAAPPSTKPAPRKTLLRFDVLAPPQPKEPEVPPEPTPQPTRRAAAPRPAREPAVAPPPPPPPPPEPVSGGVTLAGQGNDASFSMPLAHGGSLEPAARPRVLPPVNIPTPTPAPPSPRVTEPPVVAVGDLSSRPSPPSLADALQRNYPSGARQRGLSGTAKVRARIDPDGVVRRVSLLEESAAGFGAACSRTLTGSRWAAPKDKAGRSVATEIRYTCRFVVAP